MIEVNKLKEGNILSESSHYIFSHFCADAAVVKHLESGDTVTIGNSYVQKYLNSGDLYTEEVKVGKESKKDGTLGIRDIWENIHSSQVFTVCFEKQEKSKTKKQFELEKENQRNQAIELIDRAKRNKKSMAIAYKEALEFIQNNPISNIIKGEERILRGYKIQFESRDGFYDCVDMDINDKNNIRKVNIRTIKWLIFNGTKYIIE